MMQVSGSIKEERETYPIADQCSVEVRNTFLPAEEVFKIVMVSDNIKEEQWDYPMADQCSEEVKNVFCPAAQEFNVVMVSDSIKEEEESYPIAEQCSEKVNTAFCPAGVAEINAFSTNVKKEEDCTLDHQYSRMPNFVGLIGIRPLSTNVKEEEEDCALGHPDSEMKAVEEFNMMQVSGSIKEESETYPVADQCSVEVRNTFCPAAEAVLNMMQVSGSIIEERATNPVADQRSQEVGNTFCPAEDVFNLVMFSDSIKVKRVKNTFCPAEEVFKVVMVSDSIPEEREAYPIADPCSEEDKDVFCPAEEVFKIVMPSDKKDQWAFLTNAQCSEEVKNILCPTADPFAKSGISPCFPVSKKTLFQQEKSNEQEKTGAQSTNATASQPEKAEEVQQVKEGEEVLVTGTRATPAVEASEPSQWGIVTRLQSQKLTAALEEDMEQASTSLGHEPGPPPNWQRKRRRHRLLLLRPPSTWTQNSRRPHSSSSKDQVMHRILRELALMKRRMQNMAWEMANVQKKLDNLIDHIN